MWFFKRKKSELEKQVESLSKRVEELESSLITDRKVTIVKDGDRISCYEVFLREES